MEILARHSHDSAKESLRNKPVFRATAKARTKTDMKCNLLFFYNSRQLLKQVKLDWKWR